MVNTVGLDKADVVIALARMAGSTLHKNRIKYLLDCGHRGFGFIASGDIATVNLLSDEGFQDRDYDRVFGKGAAQAAIDELRMMQGGAAI